MRPHLSQERSGWDRPPQRIGPGVPPPEPRHTLPWLLVAGHSAGDRVHAAPAGAPEHSEWEGVRLLPTRGPEWGRVGRVL